MLIKQTHATAIAARAEYLANVWNRRADEAGELAAQNAATDKSYSGTEAHRRAKAATAENVARIMQGKATNTPAPIVIVPGFCLSFIVRAGDLLTMPADVKRFRDLRIERNTDDAARITCGDFAIIAPQNDFGGRSIELLTCGPDGQEEWLMTHRPDPVYPIRLVKVEIKDAIAADACDAHPSIVKGAGELAGAVRLIHALRGGFRRPAEIRAARAAADDDEKAKAKAGPVPFFEGDDAALLAGF